MIRALNDSYGYHQRGDYESNRDPRAACALPLLPGVLVFLPHEPAFIASIVHCFLSSLQQD
jgi:hypothetical protein